MLRFGAIVPVRLARARSQARWIGIQADAAVAEVSIDDVTEMHSAAAVPARPGAGDILCCVRRRAPDHRHDAITENVIDDARRLAERPATIDDGEIDCRPWPRLALGA